MLQPFERFQAGYIDRLIGLGKRYIISQTYTRARGHFDGQEMPILFSDYDDAGQAKIHYKAVIGDRFASLIQLTNPRHRAQVEKMLKPGSRYHVYWNTVKSAAALKRKIDQEYSAHIRRYIFNNTSWRIDAHQTVRPSLEVTFGELFMILRWSGQTLRVKFAEIESA